MDNHLHIKFSYLDINEYLVLIVFLSASKFNISFIHKLILDIFEETMLEDEKLRIKSDILDFVG